MKPSKFSIFFHKNSSTILTVISLAGVAVTAVLATKAGEKSGYILKEKEQELIPVVDDEVEDPDELLPVESPSKLGFADYWKLTWKYHLPTIIAGTITGGTIIFNS